MQPQHLLRTSEGGGKILPDLLRHRLVLELGQVVIDTAPGEWVPGGWLETLLVSQGQGGASPG